MNLEKLRSPARATFKNPNFQSFCELGKKLKVQPKTKIEKSQFQIYRYIGSHVSLLKIRWGIYTRLVTFQTRHDEYDIYSISSNFKNF